MKQAEKQVVIVGAGPAGLTAAYELSKAGIKSVTLEKDSVVGGISRTVNYKGYHFDIGGHRFFSKVTVVEDFWREVMPEEDFLTCSRQSRIYYNNKFFHYPLRPANALFGLGIWNSILILLSYLKSKLFPNPVERTLEQWVTNRFGERLYRTFFKTYTEKVWGIPCSEIGADWAAQRIKGLSLRTALKNALVQQRTVGADKDAIIKTLIDSFQYPKRGPGMMWETVTDKVRDQGSEVWMQSWAQRILRTEDGITAIETMTPDGPKRVEGTHFISSMPLRALMRQMDPPPPPEVLEAADKLKYRDFLTVALMIKQRDLFPDNWIYIHDPDVKVGRIQNFKNWSPHMVPDDSVTCLGLEYFCFEGDGLWTMSDEDLGKLAAREIAHLKLANAEDVIDSCVVRMPKAYPVYDSEYQDALKVIRGFLKTVPNLQVVGRNGMHRYNNQDHSMLTAMLAVRNILGANYDLWKVNDDNDYHEEVKSHEDDQFSRDLREVDATQPMVPQRVSAVAV